MKNFLDDPDDLQNERMTKEDKIQILIKIVPILLIILILLITLLVNHVKKQNTAEEKEDAVSTEILLPSPSAEITDQVADDGMEDDKTSSFSEEETESPESTPSPSPEEVFDYSKVEFDTQTQLEEMMGYWKDGNQAALDDLANLERFRAMSYQLKGTTAFNYAGDVNEQGEPHGTGIAVYADNQYYYGEWKNGKRDGEGKWMHYHIHASASYKDVILYHQYSGSFKDDLPDGEGAEHYDLNTELFEGNNRYYTNLIGAYSKGLYHGEFYLITSGNNDDYEEWEGTAENGSFVYCSDQKDGNGRRPVVTDVADENNYIWMSDKENRNLGVKCYISKR